jgi:hypothetical protein
MAALASSISFRGLKPGRLRKRRFEVINEAAEKK